MNIRVPDSWLREYIQTEATVKDIKECLSLCGPSVERIYTEGGDSIYDIEITTNRVDTASVYGIAREAFAILPRFKHASILKKLAVKTPPNPKNPVPMEIHDPGKICNRIMGVVMEIEPMKQSHEQMRDRIEKSGSRSLNNLVDITNYVMLEVGHPCHVFDYDRIKTNKFLIRMAKKNEPIITLDDKKYLLNTQDVVIDDGTGRVIDLPGIMGTQNSVVTQNTRRILFFIESNNPTFIRKTSMRYGIRTTAATINEKHPDPELVKTAFYRGIELYQKYAGGKIIGDCIDIYPHPTGPKPIIVAPSFIQERLGVALSEKEIMTILSSLQFDIKKVSNDSLTILPPSFRQFDVTIPEDIVEEVARIYGYHNLSGKLMSGEIPTGHHLTSFEIEAHAKTMLKYWGFTETYSYSFVSKTLLEKANLKPEDHLKVANPLTEEIEYMRGSLFPSLLAVMEKNKNLKDSLHLFELSNIYTPQPGKAMPLEILKLSCVTTSPFPILKGILTALLFELGISQTIVVKATAPFFHPQQSGMMKKGEKNLATFGTIHPEIASQFNLPVTIQLAQIDFDVVKSISHTTKTFVPISLFPPIIEDLSLIYNPMITVDEILRVISTLDTRIKTVEFRELYNETIMLQVSYQDDSKNLTNEEVKLIRAKILQTLQTSFGIVLKTKE